MILLEINNRIIEETLRAKFTGYDFYLCLIQQVYCINSCLVWEVCESFASARIVFLNSAGGSSSLWK